MKHETISLRPFIGAKDFNLSRNFYNDLGFKETVLTPTLSLFEINQLGFYLQDAFVKDWVDNTMVFLEVKDVEKYWQELLDLNLTNKYSTAKFSPIRTEDWGKECFIHDPSGILWHIGEFTKG